MLRSSSFPQRRSSTVGRFSLSRATDAALWPVSRAPESRCRRKVRPRARHQAQRRRSPRPPLNSISALSAWRSQLSPGISVPQNVTVSNTGTASLTILSVALSGSGFSVSGISSGQILASGQSATLVVIFLPLVSGNLSGGVTITTDVAGSATISLSGSGSSQPTATSVVLTWSPSASSSIAGYNIYRASSPGAESGTAPINGTSLVTADTYTDVNVVTEAPITMPSPP